ncbi:transposase-like protein [Trueperella abortisuis]|uniref:Mutator family transposase n=1 Tax=Trueperella abortisuis TaxID=445930 RepID=A0ABT9PL53_9ACTO|nr:transposase-like protein [Trueperella abortisuis]
MTMTVDEKTGPVGGDVVAELKASGALDELFARIDSGDIELTGDGGMLPALIKDALERGLQAEMTSHLGYKPHDRQAKAESDRPVNARNGSYTKTVASEVGDIELTIARDREGSFTPRLVPKGSRRLGGLDQMIISLYAGGMSVPDIQHHLAKTIGTELSHETISKITDAVQNSVATWQDRPLEEFYPVIYLDAIRVKVRDQGRVRSKAAHIAVGVDIEGIKHVLGIWVQDNEGSSFWATVCSELANRDVQDVLIVCCDGLVGLPEAIEATWPHSLVQTCVVHLIRAAKYFVAYQDRKAVSASLKTIYTAASEQAARAALEKFAASNLGQKYPSAVATWENAWERNTGVLAVPASPTQGHLHHQRYRVTELPAA